MAKKTTAGSKNNPDSGHRKAILCTCGRKMAWVKVSNKMAYWCECGRIADKNGVIK